MATPSIDYSQVSDADLLAALGTSGNGAAPGIDYGSVPDEMLMQAINEGQQAQPAQPGPQSFWQQALSNAPYIGPLVSGARAAFTPEGVNQVNRESEALLTAWSPLVTGGLTLGWGDEVAAALESVSGPKTYDQAKEDWAIRRALNDQEQPLTSGALDLTGALMLPLKGYEKLKNLGWVGKLVAGTGLGAGYGALAGAGMESGVADRLQGAIGGIDWAGENQNIPIPTGGIGGAGLGLGLTTLGVGLGAALNTPVANKLIADVAGVMADETGAVFSRRPRATAPSLTPAEAYLARSTEHIPVEDIETGIARALAARSQGSPMLPAETIDDPGLWMIARDAANSRQGRPVAEPLLRDRQLEQRTRLAQAFDAVAPRATPLEGGQQLLDAARDAQTALKAARTEAGEALYQQALKETDVVTGIDDIINSSAIQRAIKETRALRPDLYDGLPDNSLQLLHEAKQSIDDSIAGAVARGEPKKARDLEGLQQKLLTRMDKASPTYGQARKAWAEASKPINEVEETLGKFLRMSDQNAAKAGDALFGMEPQQIERVREALGPGGQEAFRAGVRAHLDRVLENTSDRRNPLEKIMGAPGMREKLRAALDIDTADELRTFLVREDEMWATRNNRDRAFLGSQTAPALEEMAARNQTLGELVGAARSPGSIKQKLADAALRAFYKGTEDPKQAIMEDVARALFGQNQSIESWQNIANFRQFRGPIDQWIMQAEKTAAQGGPKATIVIDKKKGK